MGGKDPTTQSPMDAEISRLDEDVKQTRKVVKFLAKELTPILSPPPPTPEGEPEAKPLECSLGDRIIAIQHSAKGNIQILNNIIERLRV